MAYGDNIPGFSTMDINQRLALVRYFAAVGGLNPAPYEEQVIREYAVTHYGAMGAYMSDPEIGPLLLRAAREGWDELRFKAELANTNWYKSQTGSQREWDMLVRTDPASAKQKVDQLKGQINVLLSQEGVADQFTDARITTLATDMLRQGATGDMIPRMVLAEVQYNPTMAAGKLGETMNSVGAKADSFLVPVSDQVRFDWAKKIEMGTATQEGLDAYLRQTAEAQYGSDAVIADALNRGFTMKQILDPQIQTAAQLLEVDPESLNFGPGSQWSSILNGGEKGLMNSGEVAKFVRSTADFRQTSGAAQVAAAGAEQLAKLMGAA